MGKAILYLLVICFFSCTATVKENNKDINKSIKYNSLNCKCDSIGNCKCDSIGYILESLELCLNISEQKWEDTIKKNPDIELNWQYFYDTTYYKIHKMNNSIVCDSLFLLEIQINHGSGEYDNYVIRKNKNRYEIIQDFKGYLKKVKIYNNGYYNFIYRFFVSPNIFYDVLGSFNGNKLVTDTILLQNDKHKYYINVFKKGDIWK